MEGIGLDGPRRGPREEPIGLLLTRVGRVVERAFDDVLAAAGGTRPTWLILLAVKSGAGRTQARIAGRLGLSGPTISHHLDQLEASGIVVRGADPANRRLKTITLTAAGDVLFLRLRDAAAGFDRRLRECLEDEDTARLRRLLRAVHDNAAATRPPVAEP